MIDHWSPVSLPKTVGHNLLFQTPQTESSSAGKYDGEPERARKWCNLLLFFQNEQPRKKCKETKQFLNFADNQIYYAWHDYLICGVVVGCWMLCASLTPGAVPDVASRRRRGVVFTGAVGLHQFFLRLIWLTTEMELHRNAHEVSFLLFGSDYTTIKWWHAAGSGMPECWNW